MITIALSIAPIFLLIVDGLALRRGGISLREILGADERRLGFSS